MDKRTDQPDQGRARGLYDEQLQRLQQEHCVDPAKADDEQKAARAAEATHGTSK